MRVLLLDLTHGASILAQEYRRQGNQVTCVDVYSTAGGSQLRNLKSQGIRVLDDAPSEEFDLLVSPIHCPDSYIGNAAFKRRITHHEAAGELAQFERPTIEVTGAGAKTSTCHVIAHMLTFAGLRVFLLTSSGISLVNKGRVEIIHNHSSIAPASVLEASLMKVDYDWGVFEVSLGGTGAADVGVITTLGNDYPIAKGTRSAYDGKSQMVRLAKKRVVVPMVEVGVWKPLLEPGVEMTTFGIDGDVELMIPRGLQLESGTQARIRTSDIEESIDLPGGYLIPAYLTALNASLGAISASGTSMHAAINSLKTFRGVPGRGEVHKEDDCWVIRDRNPGVSAASLDWLLRVLEDSYGINDIGVVIDPVSPKVCEKLDLEQMSSAMDHYRSVCGRYLLGSDMKERRMGFRNIRNVSEIKRNHKALLWCTKEGYV